MSWIVREITTEQVQPIRLAVLRADTSTKETRFAEDDWPGAVHLGAFDGEHLIATSTWIPREHASKPGTPAVQLRGMATLQSHQSRGVGAALVAAGIGRARADGARLVWANARDAAMAFYEREGFRVEGDGFIDATTQLPHHVVVIDT
ncbi:MAG: GNAT family N-acetyltransferase [Ilumatobacteraceae bacterium]